MRRNDALANAGRERVRRRSVNGSARWTRRQRLLILDHLVWEIMAKRWLATRTRVAGRHQLLEGQEKGLWRCHG